MRLTRHLRPAANPLVDTALAAAGLHYAGYAQTTDRIPVEKADLNPDGRFFTLQSRVAYEF